MQTKKRAKSVSFGKKETPKETHEPKEHKVVASHHEKPAHKEDEETKIEIESVTAEVSVLDAPEEEEEKVVATPTPKIEEDETPEKEEPLTVPSSKEVEEEISFDEKELEEDLPKERSAFSSDTYEEEKVGGKSNFFIYFLIVALVSFVVGLLCMAGIDYVVSNKPTDINSFFNAPTSTPAPSKAVTPSPTPIKAVDLSTYNIQVLNGSGVKGEAAKVREGLVGEGFKVASSGNAATQDYEKTELAAKKGVDAAYLAKLKAYLEKESYVVEESTLSDDSKTDVVITIGQ